MKLVTFMTQDGQARLGAMDGDTVADLSGLSMGLVDLIRGGATALDAARAGLDSAPRTPRSSVRLLAPVVPGKCLASGVNYHALVIEAGMAAPPAEPFFFAKLPSSFVGDDAEVVKPGGTEQLDWEVEFTAVIGRRLHQASEDEVMDAIFGYTLLNDLSARDVQGRDNQITLGKNFTGFGPSGPCIVTTDELSDISDIRVTTHVNGEMVQDDTTANWIFSLPRLVSFLSQVMPLEPGDMVTTGTTAGLGMFMKPPRFLKPGDVVEIAATHVGSIRTKIVAEKRTNGRV